MRPAYAVRIVFCSAVFGVASASGALPLPSYEISALGLTDAEHTGSGGFRFSVVELLSDAGTAAGVSSRFGGPGSSAWVYDGASHATTRAGLFDAEHTRSDGYQESRPTLLSDSTFAAGYSVRFGGPTYLGQSAWVYDTASTTSTRAGFFDAEHTRSDGYQYTFVANLADSGAATGYSERFDGADARGYSAWLDAGGATTQLGFVDSDHTRADGYRASFASTVTNSGYVIGSSDRYAGAAYNGQAAWLYDANAATTTTLGLLDSLHTRSDGFRSSSVDLLTEAGNAAGASSLGGDGSLGQSAWVYEHASGTTTRVGYFDPDHTSGDGYQYSSINQLTETGYAVGHSTRYAGGSEGQSAWLYDVANAATTRLGLTDVEHTDASGLQSSAVQAVTASGNALGTSWRFAGFQYAGTSAWVYERAASLTARVGLFDADHTRSDGYQYSFAGSLTDSGFAIGFSERYGASGSLGTSAWVHDAASGTTTGLGLYDAMHTSSDGSAFSDASLVTESGYVAGWSDRYSGADPAGQTAWVYVAATGNQYSIVLSETSSGYASSNVSILTEDGLAFGSYTLFGDGGNQGERAFAWTAEDGAIDLGALVEGGLDPADWEYLESARRTNQLRQVVGQGRLPSGGTMAFLMTPLPEPGALPLLALGATLVLRVRRRR